MEYVSKENELTLTGNISCDIPTAVRCRDNCKNEKYLIFAAGCYINNLPVEGDSLALCEVKIYEPDI